VKSSSLRAVIAAAALLAGVLLPAMVPARDNAPDPKQAYQNLLTPILASGETVLGQPINYPTGKPLVTGAIVTIPPGNSTGWHIHAVPLFAYVLEGELTVDYGSKGTKLYRAGEGTMEAIDWPHNGTNRGTVPVKLVAVYIGAQGTDNATPVAAAQ
jgi:quercetin dioxygenase-like cupin family protein